ncbi:MAG: glycosyltransferase family 4 protein [Flavobacterium sp.]|nr:glycosyltransferase family 4 protein [Flavobacterium sp.]
MRNILYIGNALSKHGLNQTSIETLGPLLEKEGYRVWYASSRKNKAFRLLEMIWVTIRHAGKADYVLIDTYSTYNFWYAFLISQICRFFQLKYIMKLHGGNLPARLAKNPRLCRMIFANAYLNVAPSGYLLQAFVEAGFSNTVYVPNVIELCNYKFVERPSVRPHVLWVRSFSPIYNPEMAVYAFAVLKSEYPDAKFCMVGPDGGILNRVKSLAESLDVHIDFTGKLAKTEWTNLATQYDIFINTTHFDNTPVSVIEAMALGLSVVSTNVGGIPFLLENRKTALLVADDDVQGMVDCIKELLVNDNLHSELTQNAFELVQNFDAAKVRFEWLKILK